MSRIAFEWGHCPSVTSMSTYKSTLRYDPEDQHRKRKKDPNLCRKLHQCKMLCWYTEVLRQVGGLHRPTGQSQRRHSTGYLCNAAMKITTVESLRRWPRFCALYRPTLNFPTVLAFLLYLNSINANCCPCCHDPCWTNIRAECRGRVTSTPA